MFILALLQYSLAFKNSLTRREGPVTQFTVIGATVEHPGGRNLGDDQDENDGATQMLITRSLFVQMVSMRYQMKGICD